MVDEIRYPESLFTYGPIQLCRVQLTTFERDLSALCSTLCGFRIATVKIFDPEVVAVSGSDCRPNLVPTDSLQDRVKGSVLATSEGALGRSRLRNRRLPGVLAATLSKGQVRIYVAAERTMVQFN